MDDGQAGVADFVRQAGAQAKQTAASLADEAQTQIRSALDAQVQTGANLIARVAESVRIAAEHLEPDAPHLAGLVHSASERMDAVASDLDGQGAEDLLRISSDFIRREPGLAFGAAAAVGFALVRLLKTRPQPRARQGRRTGATEPAPQPGPAEGPAYRTREGSSFDDA